MSASTARPLGSDGRRRGPGRPRLVEPKATVCGWLDASKHDQLIAIANREEKSVSQLVVEAVEKTYFGILKP